MQDKLGELLYMEQLLPWPVRQHHPNLYPESGLFGLCFRKILLRVSVQ